MVMGETLKLIVVCLDPSILDEHFSHIFVVKYVMFEKTKINEKDARDGLFKKLFCVNFCACSHGTLSRKK